MDKTKNNTLLIPIAIIVAGVLVAGSIYFGGSKNSGISLTGSNSEANTSVEIAPITTNDHIIGSKDADLVVVEYSDFECPFCKAFHNTMHQIVDSYNGKVAWVYRQFPIEQLHPRALKEAEASECATDQGGNTMFWKFADKIFEVTTSNNTLDPAQLPVIAGQIGLDVNAFNTCLSSGKHTNDIQADINAAVKAGAQGTPYSVILKNGKVVGEINGAQPIDVVKTQIDSLLK
jgi:protein-disulfide isomerase